MKKIVLSAVVCTLILSLLCSCDLPSLGGGGKYEFVENGDAYTFVGVGKSKDTEIVIPDTYKGKPVTAIGDRALYFNLAASLFSSEETVDITSVTLPDTITSIGKEAFANNHKLTSVNSPASVTSIGESAFYNCTALTSITVPDGVTEIKDFTFADCSDLTSVTLPDSITALGVGVFLGCTDLETIKLPEGITAISERCFKKCYSLKNFTISDKITSIGDYAFSNCDSLGQMTIPPTVTTLGEYVFYEVGEGVEISVSYDAEIPDGWSAKWYGNMLGGKAFNTSEVYYNNVVVPNQEQAAILEGKIAKCHEDFEALSNEIGRLNEASKPYQAAENATMIKYYRDQINSCKDEQRSILKQLDTYKADLKKLKVTNQLNV